MRIDITKAHELGTEMLSNVVRICDENRIMYYAAYGTALGAVRHHGPIPWDPDIDIFVPENEMENFLSIMHDKLPPRYWVHDSTNGNHPRCFARIGLKGYKTETFHIDVFRLAGAPDTIKKQREFIKKGRMLFVAWKAKAVDPDYYYKNRKSMRIKAKIFKTLLAPIPINSIINAIDKICNQYNYESARYVCCPLEGSMKYVYPKSFFEGGVFLDYEGFLLRLPKEYDEYLKQLYGNYMEFPPEKERNAGINHILSIRELEQ